MHERDNSLVIGRQAPLKVEEELSKRDISVTINNSRSQIGPPSHERSSEDSVSDMGKGVSPPIDQSFKEPEKHQDIKEMVARMEIINEGEKYDDPFQSSPANLKYHIRS